MKICYNKDPSSPPPISKLPKTLIQTPTIKRSVSKWLIPTEVSKQGYLYIQELTMVQNSWANKDSIALMAKFQNVLNRVKWE